MGQRATRLADGFGATLAALGDLVWPVTCGGCQRPGTRWCPVCAAGLDQPARTTRPDPCPPNLPVAWAVSPYGGPVRQAIVAWKDEGRHDLTRPLAGALSRSVVAALEGTPETPAAPHPVLLVPMPSRPAARRARGADPVREVSVAAARIARRGGWTLRVAPVLRHVRAVADQSGLTAAQRAANLAGAIDVPASRRPMLAGAACLLVDDVITTGATLAEAAAAVRRAGGHPLGVAVIAATQRTLGSHVTNFQIGD